MHAHEWVPSNTLEWFLQELPTVSVPSKMQKLTGADLLACTETDIKANFTNEQECRIVWCKLQQLRQDAENESFLVALRQQEEELELAFLDQGVATALADEIKKQYSIVWDRSYAELLDKRYNRQTSQEGADQSLAQRMDEELHGERASIIVAQERLDAEFARRLSRSERAVGETVPGLDEALRAQASVSLFPHGEDTDDSAPARAAIAMGRPPTPTTAACYSHGSRASSSSQTLFQTRYAPDEDQEAGPSLERCLARLDIEGQENPQGTGAGEYALLAGMGTHHDQDHHSTLYAGAASGPREGRNVAGTSFHGKGPRVKDTSRTSYLWGECFTCLETKKVVLLQCAGGHASCKACLTKLFRTASNDRTMLPVRCCNTYLDLSLAASVLDPHELLILTERTAQVLAKDSMHCPSCNSFINLDNLTSNALTSSSFQCPACLTAMLCCRCKTLWHQGVSCEKNKKATLSKQEQDLAIMAGREGWQRCGRCSMFVELIHGCNHMTCVCLYEFCYQCGAKWKTCACSQWQEQNLYREAGQRAEREVRRGGEDVNRNEAFIGHVRRLQRENEAGYECRHTPDLRGNRVEGYQGLCANCNFEMHLYGYLCACGSAFCFTCHFHRMRQD